MVALRSLQRSAGNDVGLLAMAGDFRLLSEKLDEMGNLGVATSFERLLNAADDRAEFGGAFSIQFLDLIGLFRDDVVGIVAIEFDLVKAGSVMEITEANEADFLESSEATINGHEIASRVREITVDLLDAGGLRTLDQGFEDRDARLGDP